MPTISIFIRKDDLPKWQALENKSAWLHEHLNPTQWRDATPDEGKDYRMTRGGEGGTAFGAMQVPVNPNKMKAVELKEPGYVFVPRPPDPETGYPCCLKAQPCKHWSYDGNSGLWINELTGKTQEVSQ